MSYAEVDDLRDYLSQTSNSGAATDEVLESILARATSIIRTSMCNMVGDRAFEFGAYTLDVRTVWGTYSPYLLLPSHAPRSVTLVRQRSVLDGSLVVIDESTYEARPDGRLYWIANDLWGDRPAVWAGLYHVTAQWGYGVIPPDIQEVCLELAVNIFTQASKGDFSDVIGVGDGGAITVASKLTKFQQERLVEAARLYRLGVPG